MITRITSILIVFGATCSCDRKHEDPSIRFGIQRTIEGSGRQFVAFSKHNDLIATYSADCDICFFDSRTGKLVETIPGPMPLLGSGVFGQSALFAFSGKDNSTGIMDLETSKLSYKRIDDEISARTFANDDQLICAGTRDGRIILFDVRTDSASQIKNAHAGIIWSIASAKDLVASGGKDGFLNIWNTATHRKQRSINLGSEVRHVEFAPDA